MCRGLKSEWIAYSDYLSPFDFEPVFSSIGMAVAVGVGSTGTGARVGWPDSSATKGASVLAADGADVVTGTTIGALDGADVGAARVSILVS